MQGIRLGIECDNGKVVPQCDAAALVCAGREILGVPEAMRWVLGEAARQRIVKCFSTEWAAQQYSEIYEASREGMQ
jgi:glycosyltransferase involved in cell wall biosynthesis